MSRRECLYSVFITDTLHFRIKKTALAVVAEKKRVKVISSVSPGWLASLKKGPVSFSQVVHCNPPEGAYWAHCLSHCCLSGFRKTLHPLYADIHVAHTHIVPDFHMHSLSVQGPQLSFNMLASTDCGRGGKSSEI